MRGKLRVDFYFSAPARITPADAGKTESMHIYMRRRERITPADAGKTQGRLLVTGVRKDHPRGCGENGADSG